MLLFVARAALLTVLVGIASLFDAEELVVSSLMLVAAAFVAVALVTGPGTGEERRASKRWLRHDEPDESRSAGSRRQTWT